MPKYKKMLSDIKIRQDGLDWSRLAWEKTSAPIVTPYYIYRFL
jgi:hypothetical protein